MNSMLVIGAGRMGARLAERLMEMGNEVMIIDRNDEKAQKMSEICTSVKVGDCTDVETLEEIEPASFDVCFVCISDDFQASMMITAILKELGAKTVVSRAGSALHERLLYKVGCDHVVFPEKQTADHIAIKYTENGIQDYFRLSDEYAIMEINVPEKWTGQTIKGLNVRINYGINIIGMRKNKEFVPIVNSDYRFSEGDVIIVAGEEKKILSLFKSGK